MPQNVNLNFLDACSDWYKAVSIGLFWICFVPFSYNGVYFCRFIFNRALHVKAALILSKILKRYCIRDYFQGFPWKKRDGFSSDKRWNKIACLIQQGLNKFQLKLFIKELFEGIEKKRENVKRCCQYSQSRENSSLFMTLFFQSNTQGYSLREG